MTTYKIVRAHIRDSEPPRIIKTGLTLEEALAYCKNDETSWRTCTDKAGKEYTRLHGAWFDGYEVENKPARKGQRGAK